MSNSESGENSVEKTAEDATEDTSVQTDAVESDSAETSTADGAPEEQTGGAEVAPDEDLDPAADAEEAEDEVLQPVSALSLAINSFVKENVRLKDRLLRTAADFENYKKRTRRDMTERVKLAEQRVVLDFLAVADNLERALSHAEVVEGEAIALKDGMEMVQKQFLVTLDRYSIKPFDSVGDSFNPERHEAIQQLHSDEPLGTVTFEMRKGYMRGDKLVRAAMVVVSKGPAPKDEPPPPAEDEEPIPGEGGIPDEVDVADEELEAAVEAKAKPIGAPPADEDEVEDEGESEGGGAESETGN